MMPSTVIELEHHDMQIFRKTAFLNSVDDGAESFAASFPSVDVICLFGDLATSSSLESIEGGRT